MWDGAALPQKLSKETRENSPLGACKFSWLGALAKVDHALAAAADHMDFTAASSVG